MIRRSRRQSLKKGDSVDNRSNNKSRRDRTVDLMLMLTKSGPSVMQILELPSFWLFCSISVCCPKAQLTGSCQTSIVLK
jgi:hypothetical protein